MVRVAGGLAGLALAGTALSGCGLLGDDEAATASGLDLSAPPTTPAPSAPEAVAFAAAGNAICDEEIGPIRLQERPRTTEMDRWAAWFDGLGGAYDRVVARIGDLPVPPGDEEAVATAVAALTYRAGLIDRMVALMRTGDEARVELLMDEEEALVPQLRSDLRAAGLVRCTA